MDHTEAALCSMFGRYAAQTSQEWISVLRVAHYMRFESLRGLAVQELYAVASPVEKIVCARDFGIDHWLKEAYTDICYRSLPLFEEEGIHLGLSTCLKIASAREAIRGSTAVIDSVHADSVIRNTFDLGMEQREATVKPAPFTVTACRGDEHMSKPAQSIDHTHRSSVHNREETSLHGIPQDVKSGDMEQFQHTEWKQEVDPRIPQLAQMDVTKPEACVSESMSHRAEEATGSTYNHNRIPAEVPPPVTKPNVRKPLMQMSKKQRQIAEKKMREEAESRLGSGLIDDNWL
jgi:hypothetical protein